MGAGTTEAKTRLDTALAAIDLANHDDPHSLSVRGRRRPKELAHAELVSEWVRRLEPDASDALLLAARAHHVRRWEIARDQYPKGRSGYLRWRKELQKLHARVSGEILRGVGYDEVTIERVRDIVRKRGLGRDPEVQVFEDALCLTFLETQLAAFATNQPDEKAREVLAKTAKKMSPTARRLADTLSLPAAAREVLDGAAGHS